MRPHRPLTGLGMWQALALLGNAGLAAAAASCSAEDSTCRVADGPVSAAGDYYWPMGMGHPSYYSNPPWPGPTDLQKDFSWSWFGPTNTRYEESFVGAVIDEKKNIYVNGDRNAYKLSPTGVLLWNYYIPGQSSGDGPAIYAGRFYGSTNGGKIYAVNMETGVQSWVTQVSSHDGFEYSQLAAHQGVLITQGEMRCQDIPFQACACGKVFGLNTTDGNVLWKYDPNEVLWDWFPQFPDDETVVFMDKTGGLHRLMLQTGEVVWRTSGTPGTWTDGSQFVASNGLTYAVQVLTPSTGGSCPPPKRGEVLNCNGYVTAHNTTDGTLVWRATVPKPPNTSPALGPLGSGGKLALIMPIGQQSQDGCMPQAFTQVYSRLSLLPEWLRLMVTAQFHKLSVWLGDSNGWLWGTITRRHDVLALDPDTGKTLWTWAGPTSDRKCNRGDEDGFIPRATAQKRMVSCPTPWSQPHIGPDGTIYTGNENGDVFALRDANGDGRVDDKEVSVYHTDATFPHPGLSHAPGMLVAVNFDGVFVWKS
mmetsp:Transcript_141701/g.440542  ORF Transcript_141701/g.440542 Transcript_141701/m.440542 type:complete len:533 (-) Transcript_141701:108-1706(-)